MKKIILILIKFLFFSNTYSQILDPIKWTTKIEKKSETNYLITFSGTIEKGWHLYSQYTDVDGSMPMTIIFNNQKGNFNLVGKAKESKTNTKFNDVFGVNETYFEKKVVIIQEVNILKPIPTIKVNLNYQVCKDVCINLEKEIILNIPKTVSTKLETNSSNELKKGKISTQKELKKKTSLNKKPSPKGLWSIFFIAFLSGFAALLTPCVFPMIPMTVSFFTKQSKTKAAGIKNAILYGFSIIIIYVVLGFLVTWIFGADALNALSTNVWFNIIFFILLIVFASSFLGAFEIMLPNSWANKIDSQADRGGIIGILFMALALAIVSFSCTGPIVGTLLVEAASKGGITPIIGMLGFSLALALPFMLFAMFPGWLNSLPKSGGWLNIVKVVLGFLELALAFKFLSNADLVLQLHLLDREVFIAIWIAIFGVLSLYLLGKITLPHDSPLPFISVGRLLFGLTIMSFTIYMIPGLWGAPLKLIDAFPPPLEYSESPFGIGTHKTNETSFILPDGANIGVQGITVFNDYEKGLAYAKKENKPIMLDFTGHACVNCRKMENNVWSDKIILKILTQDIVVISLYVDDKRDLPKKEQFVSKTTGSRIETIGDKWTDFMISKYKTNTQPLYVLEDLKGNSLNLQTPTISYTSISEYEAWLKNGLKNFK